MKINAHRASSSNRLRFELLAALHLLRFTNVSQLSLSAYSANSCCCCYPRGCVEHPFENPALPHQFAKVIAPPKFSVGLGQVHDVPV